MPRETFQPGLRPGAVIRWTGTISLHRILAFFEQDGAEWVLTERLKRGSWEFGGPTPLSRIRSGLAEGAIAIIGEILPTDDEGFEAILA